LNDILWYKHRFLHGCIVKQEGQCNCSINNIFILYIYALQNQLIHIGSCKFQTIHRNLMPNNQFSKHLACNNIQRLISLISCWTYGTRLPYQSTMEISKYGTFVYHDLTVDHQQLRKHSSNLGDTEPRAWIIQYHNWVYGFSYNFDKAVIWIFRYKVNIRLHESHKANRWRNLSFHKKFCTTNQWAAPNHNRASRSY
jgi:hypothetical protein